MSIDLVAMVFAVLDVATMAASSDAKQQDALAPDDGAVISGLWLEAAGEGCLAASLAPWRAP